MGLLDPTFRAIQSTTPPENPLPLLTLTQTQRTESHRWGEGCNRVTMALHSSSTFYLRALLLSAWHYSFSLRDYFHFAYSP